MCFVMIGWGEGIFKKITLVNFLIICSKNYPVSIHCSVVVKAQTLKAKAKAQAKALMPKAKAKAKA